MDQSGKRGQGRSKGKSKGKSKSKGKGRGSSPPQEGSAKSRVKAFFGGGRQLCVRCGAAGHQARNCPSQGNKKRKHEDGDDPVHMVETTTMMDYFTDIPEDIPSDVAVQDGGAASFLGSFVQIRKYLRYLVDLGYDITTVQIYRCKKGFKYGNSEKEIATTCLMLPIFAGHRRRHVLCYAVGGSCPILIGRPLLEKLGLTVDYSKRKYKWKGQQWQNVQLGPKNEYLVRLAENCDELIYDIPEALIPEVLDSFWFLFESGSNWKRSGPLKTCSFCIFCL